MTPENKQLLQAIIEVAKKACNYSEDYSERYGIIARKYNKTIDPEIFIQELEKLLIKN